MNKEIKMNTEDNNKTTDSNRPRSRNYSNQGSSFHSKRRPSNSSRTFYRHKEKKLEAKPEIKEEKEAHEKENLRILFLGGTREIGKNSTLFQYGDESVMVDFGVFFSKASAVESILLPDINYLLDNRDKLKAIIFTHGHEDHIGGIEFLIKKLGFPIKMIGGLFTIELVRSKLEKLFLEKGWKLNDYLVVVKGREEMVLGKYFKAEFFDITHSIPDSFFTLLYTPHHRIGHTGDFKFDLCNNYFKDTDFFSLAKIGENGVDILLSDSTNADKDGFSSTEDDIYHALEDKFLGNQEKRIIISLFSSHIARIFSAIRLTQKHNRKLVVAGNSMNKNIELALKLGYLDIKSNLIVPLERVNSHHPKSLVILCTGAQGESNAVLHKIANNNHRFIKIREDDLVILSAKTIPGNEKNVVECINKLMINGASVIYNDSYLHASGHGYRNDIRLMLKLIKPKLFFPVHGEYCHMVSNRKTATGLGLAYNNIYLAENGDHVSISKEKTLKLLEKRINVPIILDKNSIEINRGTAEERTNITEKGLLSFSITIKLEDKKLETLSLLNKGLEIKDLFSITDLETFLRKEILTKTDTIKKNYKDNFMDAMKKFVKMTLETFLGQYYTDNMPVLAIHLFFS